MAGGSSSQQPSQTTTTAPSPQAQALFNVAFPKVSQFAATTPTRYQGETVAGFTPDQLAAQDAARAAAAKQGAVADWASQTAMGIPANLTPFVGKDLATSSDVTVSPDVWAASTPTLNAAIEAAQRPTWEALTEQALPNIRSTGLATGPFGGSRQGVAEGVATGKAFRGAGDIAAGMTNTELQKLQDLVNQRYATNIAAENQRYATNVTGAGQRYGQNLAAMYQALGMAPTLSALETAPATTYGAVGDVNQAMNQARINAAIQGFNFDELAPYLQAKDIMALAQGFPGGTTTSTANVPQANPWMQSLGGAATGASLGSMFGPVGMGVGAAGGAVMPFLFR